VTAPRDMSMLELELELAYRDSPDRVEVRTAVGPLNARIIRSGGFVAFVVPWGDDTGAATEFADEVRAGSVDVRRRPFETMA
jgi:hypothetical protein